MSEPFSEVRAIVSPGFHSVAGFELLQREARMFIASSMIPDTFRQWSINRETGQMEENAQALSNCIIALNMAYRMSADPLMVMQNLYIVNGRPAWSAKFLIALFNTCGRFTTIRYVYDDAKGTCYAVSRELATDELLVGPTVSIAMAKAAGWFDRKGSQWRTMPEVMLKNRAAAFLIRLTAPELSMGLPMRDEAGDIVDIEAQEVEPESPTTPLQAVRDILSQEPRRSTHAAMTPEPIQPVSAPAPESEPFIEGQEVIEPKDLPIKDAPPREEARARTKRVDKPAFNMDAYARRIAGTSDLDMLTLMRDEIAALDPSPARDDLMSLLDARTRELITVEEGDLS